MDSTPVDDERAELARIVADLRAQVARHARAGAWGAPGGASPVTVSEAAAVAVTVTETAAVTDTAAETVAAAVTATVTATAAAAVTETVTAAATVSDLDEPAPRRRLTLLDIRTDLGECTRCKLHRTRNKIVFGVGASDAPLMFVGEAPGADEDRLGDPFVGRAGELLDKMIEAMGWTRNAVYIANVLKCRPPGNRTPEPDEVQQCQPFLAAQIASVAPRVLVALGRPAANVLLGNNAPISALRGRFHEYRGIRLMPTFHPAFLLRSPDRKRDAWNDLKMVMGELDRLGVAAPRTPR